MDTVRILKASLFCFRTPFQKQCKKIKEVYSSFWKVESYVKACGRYWFETALKMLRHVRPTMFSFVSESQLIYNWDCNKVWSLCILLCLHDCISRMLKACEQLDTLLVDSLKLYEEFPFDIKHPTNTTSGTNSSHSHATTQTRKTSVRASFSFREALPRADCKIHFSRHFSFCRRLFMETSVWCPNLGFMQSNSMVNWIWL